jgi:hypothetical protein
VAYLVQGDEALFGISAMVAMLSVLAVLLGCGRAIWRNKALGRWSFGPGALGWVTIAAIPVGGALAEVDERLLEVPLLVVGLMWVGLGVVLASAQRVRGNETTVAVSE